MKIFKKLFAITSDTSNDISNKKEIMDKVLHVNKKSIPSNSEIIYQSEIPKYCSIGNLIFEKKFIEAIELGEKLLEETPNSEGIHVNLMDAYFKARNTNPIFLEKSIEHAKLAMLYGHNTGYVQERLVINLEKLGKIHQAIQICNIVLMEQFHFSTHGCGNKVDFKIRKEKLIKKLSKATDSLESILFTSPNISFIIEQLNLEEERLKKEKIEYDKRMKQLDKDLFL